MSIAFRKSICKQFMNKLLTNYEQRQRRQKIAVFFERKKGTASAVRLCCSSNQDGNISRWVVICATQKQFEYDVAFWGRCPPPASFWKSSTKTFDCVVT